jgi:hypothetical protein
MKVREDFFLSGTQPPLFRCTVEELKNEFYETEYLSWIDSRNSRPVSELDSARSQRSRSVLSGVKQ